MPVIALDAFNPTLVQFKLNCFSHWWNARPAFNPTLVQFKLDPFAKQIWAVKYFQSYLSPIQTDRR